MLIHSSTGDHAGSPPGSSPSSSILSDLPPPHKKRRISMSSLSGEEGDGDDDDEEPLATRMAQQQQSPTKSPKKPTAGKTAKSAPTGRMPTTTGKTNGFVEPEPRIKIEDKMDDAQLDRLATGVPVDSETTAVSLCDSPISPLNELTLICLMSSHQSKPKKLLR